jgi:hypothetical protein
MRFSFEQLQVLIAKCYDAATKLRSTKPCHYPTQSTDCTIQTVPALFQTRTWIRPLRTVSRQAFDRRERISERAGETPVQALAHLGLARARAAAANKDAAKTAYQDFFALWKDADPDLPLLKQAKAEYSKLQ